MDNEPIFTEYELSLKRAREDANRLAGEANELLAHLVEMGLNAPATMTTYAGTMAGHDMSQIILDPHTMEFVTVEELKRRDAENVEKLKEISGK